MLATQICVGSGYFQVFGFAVDVDALIIRFQPRQPSLKEEKILWAGILYRLDWVSEKCAGPVSNEMKNE
jgi:hypothetical protein